MSNVNRGMNNFDEEDQINLQTLQNRDPDITKIIDQAQRVCVYKFMAEKREWERQEIEGTLFVYERTSSPHHGFVILSTVSREIFVQIIKSTMEFKHSLNYEAFLQYKIDLGDIYGIWFISTNDCPRVTECLKNLTIEAKESEQWKQSEAVNSTNIFSLLTNAQDKFEESKRQQDSDISMPAALLRLFPADENTSQLASNDEREQELKRTLGILGKPALSVTELETQFIQPSLNHPLQSLSPCVLTDAIKAWTVSNENLLNGSESNGHLMIPSQFQTLRITQSPVLLAPVQINSTSSTYPCHTNHFSKDILRQLLIDLLQNDDEFLTGLHNVYTERQNRSHRIDSSNKP